MGARVAITIQSSKDLVRHGELDLGQLASPKHDKIPVQNSEADIFPDIVIGQSSPKEVEGYLNFYRAILEEARINLLSYTQKRELSERPATKAARGRNIAEVWQWLHSPETSPPSFLFICDLLKIDPGACREELWKQQEALIAKCRSGQVSKLRRRRNNGRDPNLAPLQG